MTTTIQKERAGKDISVRSRKEKTMKNTEGKWLWRVICIVVVLMIAWVVFLVGAPIVGTFNTHTATVTVTDKEHITNSTESKYLIFGKDENGKAVVYENTDNILRGKWDASTLQAEMEVGQTYEVKLVGFRFPIFSWYENILDAEPVGVKDQ